MRICIFKQIFLTLQKVCKMNVLPSIRFYSSIISIIKLFFNSFLWYKQTFLTFIASSSKYICRRSIFFYDFLLFNYFIIVFLFYETNKETEKYWSVFGNLHVIYFPFLFAYLKRPPKF